MASSTTSNGEESARKGKHSPQDSLNMSGTFNKLNSSLKMQQRKQLKLSSSSQTSLQPPATPDMKPKAPIPPPPLAKPLGAKFPPPPPLVALGSTKKAVSEEEDEESESSEEEEEPSDEESPSDTDLERS